MVPSTGRHGVPQPFEQHTEHREPTVAWIVVEGYNRSQIWVVWVPDHDTRAEVGPRPPLTKPYDRTQDELTLDEIERIVV